MSILTDMNLIKFFKNIIDRNSKNIINGILLDKKIFDSYSGKIYKGKHLKSSKDVVIKFCKKEKDWNKEVKALRNLNHPNIVKMVGDYQKNMNVKFDNIGKVSVIALEYAYHGDLYEFLNKNKSLSEDASRTIANQIVEGLIHAYSINISHRDIKLENVFITKTGRIVIGDWGLCSFQSNNRYSESSCGTLGYMAPEILCKLRYNPSKADVWSFGVLLFSLVSGSRPYSEPLSRRKNNFDTSWKDQWLDSILVKDWDLFWRSHEKHSTIIFSDDLKDLIEKCLDPQFSKRISLTALTDHEWFDGNYVTDDYIEMLASKDEKKN